MMHGQKNIKLNVAVLCENGHNWPMGMLRRKEFESHPMRQRIN